MGMVLLIISSILVWIGLIHRYHSLIDSNNQKLPREEEFLVKTGITSYADGMNRRRRHVDGLLLDVQD